VASALSRCSIAASVKRSAICRLLVDSASPAKIWAWSRWYFGLGISNPGECYTTPKPMLGSGPSCSTLELDRPAEFPSSGRESLARAHLAFVARENPVSTFFRIVL
jgi:hypothetical protein